jgi:hypothetical protein
MEIENKDSGNAVVALDNVVLDLPIAGLGSRAGGGSLRLSTLDFRAGERAGSARLHRRRETAVEQEAVACILRWWAAGMWVW